MKSEFQDLLSAYDDLRSMYKTQIETIYLLLILTVALFGTIIYFVMRRIKHK